MVAVKDVAFGNTRPGHFTLPENIADHNTRSICFDVGFGKQPPYKQGQCHQRQTDISKALVFYRRVKEAEYQHRKPKRDQRRPFAWMQRDSTVGKHHPNLLEY